MTISDTNEVPYEYDFECNRCENGITEFCHDCGSECYSCENFFHPDDVYLVDNERFCMECADEIEEETGEEK